MNESRAKAEATRLANLEKRKAAHQQKVADQAVIRAGLVAILNDQNASNAEKLEAAKLMIEINKY